MREGCSQGWAGGNPVFCGGNEWCEGSGATGSKERTSQERTSQELVRTSQI